MTECERLVLEKCIKKDFFAPEIKCGFKVDEERKKVWAVEIDLYKKFAEVCDKHGLKYFLVFGSLLGCIRHKGFIPWDDDLDVGMPREDYDKLLELSDEFTYPYFLQTPMTDENSGFSVAKLRNSNTTAIAEPFRYQRMNHGIFIDINPMDKIEMSSAEETYHKVRELALQNSAFMRISNPNPSVSDRERIERWQGRSAIDVFDEIQLICKKSKEDDTKHVGLLASTIYDYKKQIFYVQDFDEIIWKEFEGIKVPVPSGYKNILMTTYGDYMKFPPEDERGKAHDSIVFDANKSYKELVTN